MLTPVGAFLSIAAKQKYAFLLESVEGGEKIGRYTFLGAQPRMVITARGQELSRARQDQRSGARAAWSSCCARLATVSARNASRLAAVYLRRRGILRLRHGAAVRAPAGTAKDDLELPDCVFTFYDRLLAFDHLRHQLHIIAAADVRSESPRKAYDRALADIDAIERKLVRGISAQHVALVRRGEKKPIKVHACTSHDRFIANVSAAKEYIAAGDIFQVVLSQRLDFKPPADPFQIYRALRTVNPSPYMFFLKLDDLHVVGASPEMLVRVTGRKLEYRPIAGTRRRGAEQPRTRT